jgi:hypothetical protein
MSQEKINTAVISQFLQTIKGADLANQREVRIDIATAKNLAYTLGIVMTRLSGNYETLLSQQSTSDTQINIQMDGGNWS